MRRKGYSLLSNICFLLREVFRSYRGTALSLPIMIFAFLIQNTIMVMIPSRAVHIIEKRLGTVDFILQVGGVILLYTVVRSVVNIAENHYSAALTIVRCQEFIAKLLEKSLVTDYCNWESNACQKLNGQGVYAVAGNSLGVERVLQEVPFVMRNFLGLILFGGAIAVVDIRILLVLLLMLISNVLANRYARSYLEAHREEDAELWRKTDILKRKAADVVCGKDVRMYRMEKWIGHVLQTYVECGQRWQKKLEKRFYLPTMSDTIFLALRDGLAYILLIRKTLQGGVSLAEFTLLLGVITTFSNRMFAFVESIMNMLKAHQEVTNYRRVLDMEDSFRHGEGVKVSEEARRKAPEVELRDVCFRYEEEGEEILSHISLKLYAGEKIALVGGNGEGKTTLVKLLCGFYHPVSGEILVNGINIEEYDIEEYFRLVGVVFQDMGELPFQIVNIVSGKNRADTDMSRFWRAVERAGLREKIESLSNREETYLSNLLDEDGVRLSGGETQKLMLARCIYKDAPLLILDEPTSALDPLAESAIYQEYDRMTENKTSIFISHRLASTRFCDRILFLEHGRIVEEGTHEELLRSGGRYARIYEIQSHYYTEDGRTESRGEMEVSYE